MCEFVSFFVSVEKNAIVAGRPESHWSAPVSSADGDWREAEWTENGLTIRVMDDEDESAYRATVLALAPERAALCARLSPSTDIVGNVYHFNEHGYHRVGGPAPRQKAWVAVGPMLFRGMLPIVRAKERRIRVSAEKTDPSERFNIK